MKTKYFVATDSDPALNFCLDVTTSNIESTFNFADFERLRKDADYIFISQNRDYPGEWCSTDPTADYVIIRTSTFNPEIHKEMKNVFLLVDDEERFLDTMVSLYYETSGFIDIRLNNHFSSEVLSPQFEVLSKFMIDEIDKGDFVHVLQLNSFFTPEKFGGFGIDTFFVSPDLQVYYHPGFYYEGMKPIKSFESFEAVEFVTHFSKPHLVCHACETFYCERNVFFNKKETTELKVPAATECAKTTFMARFSKRIFNSIQNTITIVEDLNLDKVSYDFSSTDVYRHLLNGLVAVNSIKNINLNYMEKL